MVNRCWQNIATKGGIGMVNYRQLYLIVRACTLNNIGSITNAPKWADNYHAAMKFSLIRKIRGLSRFFRARSYSSRLSIYFVNESVINRNYIRMQFPLSNNKFTHEHGGEVFTNRGNFRLFAMEIFRNDESPRFDISFENRQRYFSTLFHPSPLLVTD